VADGMEGTASIRLNDALLAMSQRAPFAFEVTALLKPHNRLEVTISADSDRGGLWGEVALEIRCSAYLRDVRTRPLPDGLEVSGVVAGTSDRSLELYGLADGAHAHYQLIEARLEGTPFRFVVAPAQRLRVDLVHVSRIWSTWEQLATN
jgi:hypothetical protein